VADEGLKGTKVVVLTTFDEDADIDEAIRSGAAGYLLKDIAPDELRRAVHVVAGGEALLSPAITRRVMQRLAATPTSATQPALIAELTAREREILRHIGLGESNDEIATKLTISPATARTYVSRLLSKLDARDRSQLVIIAYESGLVRPGQG
jgi:DNA-binding NarL/FixJ family response regulator